MYVKVLRGEIFRKICITIIFPYEKYIQYTKKYSLERRTKSYQIEFQFFIYKYTKKMKIYNE